MGLGQSFANAVTGAAGWTKDKIGGAATVTKETGDGAGFQTVEAQAETVSNTAEQGGNVVSNAWSGMQEQGGKLVEGAGDAFNHVKDQHWEGLPDGAKLAIGSVAGAVTLFTGAKLLGIGEKKEPPPAPAQPTYWQDRMAAEQAAGVGYGRGM